MCSIDTTSGLQKWIIDRETLMQLYPLLYEKIEIGGKFTFPIDKNGKIQRRTSRRKIHTQKGAKDSVQAPLGIANFHTHPISCYLGEDTVYGSPSGEDLRECVLFGLKGCTVHVIVSVEGVYVIQLTPCILDSLVNLDFSIKVTDLKPSFFDNIMDHYINELGGDSSSTDLHQYLKNKGFSELDTYLNTIENDLDSYIDGNPPTELIVEAFTDIIRGIIVVFIEIFFRSTHRFRAYDLNLHQELYPIDFIKFIESFQIPEFI